MSDYIYVANSNLYIEGRRVSAVKQGLANDIREAMEYTHMNIERLSTCVSAAWMIALCAVIASAGVLFALPDDGAYWSTAMWTSIGVAWVALAAGFVLQRKFVQRVRARALLAE